MSVVFLPEGYSTGDLLVMPVYISSTESRVSTPSGWGIVVDDNNNPLEYEGSLGFLTAFYRVAEEGEPSEVELVADDETVQVVGQVLVFGSETIEESPDESPGEDLELPITWSLPPIGVFGEGVGSIEESPSESPSEEDSPDSPGGSTTGWLSTSDGALVVRSGDQLLLTTVLGEDNTLSDDQLDVGTIDTYGSGGYGEGPYGGSSGNVEINDPVQVESAFTDFVTFRTAVAGVGDGTARSVINHFADIAEDDSGMMMIVSLRTTEGDEYLQVSELEVLDAEKHDADFFITREGVNQELDDLEVFSFEEDAIPFINEFSIVFNESRRAPGFDITLGGLLEFNEIAVFRRDPLGRYSDQDVRGLTRQITTVDNMAVTDYEAPLNTVLHYYIRLINEEGEFIYGPVLPTPDPFIPTLNDAYGEGTAFFKPIDIPELGHPVMIQDMSEWTEPANILSEHHILGRKNKVVITDVRGGREGSLSGHCVLTLGQTVETVRASISPGNTILIQNHNPTMSGFEDMYVQLGDVSFTRRTGMVRHGELENSRNPQVIITFEADYTEVDRPNPQGVEITNSTWQIVYDSFITFEPVRSNRETWLDVLKRPGTPSEESEGSS